MNTLAKMKTINQEGKGLPSIEYYPSDEDLDAMYREFLPYMDMMLEDVA